MTTTNSTNTNRRVKISAPVKKSSQSLHKHRHRNNDNRAIFYTDKQAVENMLGEKSQETLEVREAKKVVIAQKSKKKKLISLLFFFINIAIIGVILFTQMQEGTVENPGELKVNWWYILAAASMVVLFVLCDATRYNILIRKSTGKNRFALAYKIGALGKYYDVITPFATGGQPFQIYYANKYGIKGGESFSIVMSKYMFQQISYSLIVLSVVIGLLITHGGIAEAIMSITNVPEVQAKLVASMAWIGVVIVFALMFSIVIVLLNKRVGVALVVGFLRIFCKIFRRNYDKMYRKTMRTVNNWQATMRRYKKSPYVWFVNIFVSIVFHFVLYSIPYFIYCAFMGWNTDVWVQIMILTIIVDLSASFNPLPGGSGVSDLSFLAVFSSMFNVTMTFWALLLWKVFTYYIFILHGLVLITYDFMIGNRRLAKNKEKWAKVKYDKIKVKNNLY